MPTVTELARVTVKDGTVWRTCTTCGHLAALAPQIDRCDTCTTTSTPAPALAAAPASAAAGRLVARGWSA